MMEEKIIIRSKPYASVSTVLIFAAIGIALALIVFMSLYAPDYSAKKEEYNELKKTYDDAVEFYETAEEMQENGMELSYSQEHALNYNSAKEYALSWFYFDQREIMENYDSANEYASQSFGLAFGIALPVVFGFTLLGLIIYLVLRNLQITVTDKRVYAHTSWWRDSSIPLYAISAVCKLPWRGLMVGSSSCKIVLLGVRNQNSIYTELNNLLMQTSPLPVYGAPATATASVATPTSAPDAPKPTSAPVSKTVPTPTSAPDPSRTSIPAESPNNLPPQIAMQAAVQSAVQSASAPSAPSLPTPPAPPTPGPDGSSIGKCTSCGKTNVPVTTITVTIAGRARTRHLCDECAAKR